MGRRWAIIRREKSTQARLTRRPRTTDPHPRRTANRDQENRDNTHLDPKHLTYITLTHHNKSIHTYPYGSHLHTYARSQLMGLQLLFGGDVFGRRQQTIARRAQARRLGRSLQWYTNNYKLIARLPGRHISSLDYCTPNQQRRIKPRTDLS